MRANNEDEQPLDQDKREDNGDQISVASYHSHLELPAPGGVAHAGEGINFYLRLGALGKYYKHYVRSMQRKYVPVNFNC